MMLRCDRNTRGIFVVSSLLVLALSLGACSSKGELRENTGLPDRDASATADAEPVDAADTAPTDDAHADVADTRAEDADTWVEDTAAPESDAGADASPRNDWLSGNGWTNVVFNEVSGTASIEYDLRAQGAAIDGVSGFTLGRAGAYTDVAMIVRLNENGMIDVRDGAGYAADVSMPYDVGVTYHVEIAADLDNHTYDVTVTEEGGSPTVVRAGAAFRTERVVDRVDHLVFLEPNDRLEVGNLRVNGDPVPMQVEPEPRPGGGLWSLDFSASPLGNYDESQIRSDWEGVRWASPDGRASIEEETGNRFLRIQYPAGGVGPSQGGAQWRVDLDGVLSQTYEELYVAYRVRFRSGFDFVRGGKLPGLLGGDGNTGGDRPDGSDGWSGRMMWRSGGDAVQYVYHPDQPGTYGEDFHWDVGSQRHFPRGQWVTVEHRIVMNTPGAHDGMVQGWWNGTLALDRRNVRFRDVSSFAIDGFYFSTFFGGSGSDWAPTRDEYIDFDDFVFSDQPITH